MIGLRIIEPDVEFITPKYFPDWSIPSLQLIEECGRVSHKSENRITENSAAPFIKRIAIDYGHMSILEHFHFTICFTCSRACSHQIVRHRISAITQESMRYCDYSKAVDDNMLLNIIVPPSIGTVPRGTCVYKNEDNDLDFNIPGNITGVHDINSRNLHVFLKSALYSYNAYIDLTMSHVPPEDARYVLSHASKTEVYITMNYHSWRNFFRLRLDKHAQWEIRMLAQKVYNNFMEFVPVIFEDMLEV